MTTESNAGEPQWWTDLFAEHPLVAWQGPLKSTDVPPIMGCPGIIDDIFDTQDLPSEADPEYEMEEKPISKELMEKLKKILQGADGTCEDIVWGKTIEPIDEKKAVIFGATGQDGYYLTELLLNKGYHVIAIRRRASTDNASRLQPFMKHERFEIVTGDVTDYSSILNILQKHRPLEIYNLAAQSHVGISFEQPQLTWEVTGQGCMNILEAIHFLQSACYKPRFYQASTSEMFGDNYSGGLPEDHKGIVDYNDRVARFQDENTPFNPQSPYAVAKLAAHHQTRLYREAYEIHASSGILFNHETLANSVPLIFKEGNLLDIKPIQEIVVNHAIDFNLQNKIYQESMVDKDLFVWDGKWVKIKGASGYWQGSDTSNKNARTINSRNGVFTATGDHVCILDDDSEKTAKELQTGDKIKLVDYPDSTGLVLPCSNEEAELLGMLVGDGNLSKLRPRFTNSDPQLKQKFIDLCKIVFQVGDDDFSYIDTKSGFCDNSVGQVICNVKYDIDIYNEITNVFGHHTKRVPKCILNGSIDIMEAFLIGYNTCDGLKKNPCKYRFKNFKTNSETLAAGLLFLVSKVTGQRYNITVDESWKYGKQQFYYSINLLSDKTTNVEKYEKVNKLLEQGVSQRQIHRDTGISRTFIRKVNNGYIPCNTHHLELCNKEIKKIIELPDYEGWFFDLATESGTFHAGIGQAKIHNSPFRGENFVTRKVTKWCAKKKWFLDHPDLDPNDKLMLGNLDSRRDWGHAKDYCINLDVPVLTVDGWKYYNDVEVGDIVINFDSVNNRLSTDEVQKKVLLDSDGEKVRLCGRGVHLDVTPNHRIYYQQKSKTSKGGWSDWKVCTAADFYDKLNRLAYRTRYDYRLPHFQGYHSNIDMPINGLSISDEMIYLLGILLSEGHLSSNKGNGNVVSISQSLIANEKVHTKIQDCIHKLDLQCRIRNRNDGVTEWLFSAESSTEILSWFDKNNVHIMPKWCYRLTSHHANILIEAMMDGDGCWGSMTYTSKRYLLAVDFQSIASLAGYRSTQVTQDKSVYRVCLITKRKKYTYIQSTDLINDGHDKVWCITTKNGTMVTRDRDCISISGNCEAMWLMLQQKKPDDYVIATGHTKSIRELLDEAFSHIGIDDWSNFVGQDPKFMRPAEVEYLLGKPEKAMKVLGWKPKTTFKELIAEMIDHDFNSFVKYPPV